MKGHSVSEVIMAGSEIDYTGIEDPSIVIALAPEGVGRRRKMLETLSPECTIIKAAGVEIPPCSAIRSWVTRRTAARSFAVACTGLRTSTSTCLVQSTNAPGRSIASWPLNSP